MTRRRKIILIVLAVLLAGWFFCLPKDLFKGTPYATVVTDRDIGTPTYDDYVATDRESREFARGLI